MHNYWSQYSHSEIMSMHGIEDESNDELDSESDFDSCDESDDECPRCSGCGCNYCLMTDY